MRIAPEGVQDPERDRSEQDDSIGIREPVSPEAELAGHEPVLGEDRGEARERVEARVRGQEQDQRGGDREGQHQD